MPCLDLRIYYKYNYCDSHTSYNPFCSLTKLQLLLLFRDFEKIFPFVNRNFISLYGVLASSDYFQFRQCYEKNALMKESFLSLDTLREFWHFAIHHYSPCMGPGNEMCWAFMRNHGNPDGEKEGCMCQRGMQKGALSSPYADRERSHCHAKKL